MKTQVGPAELRRLIDDPAWANVAYLLKLWADEWDDNIAACTHLEQRAENAETALEQVRALAEKWRKTTWDKDYGDELAALLAAASGGAA